MHNLINGTSQTIYRTVVLINLSKWDHSRNSKIWIIHLFSLVRFNWAYEYYTHAFLGPRGSCDCMREFIWMLLNFVCSWVCMCRYLECLGRPRMRMHDALTHTVAFLRIWGDFKGNLHITEFFVQMFLVVTVFNGFLFYFHLREN